MKYKLIISDYDGTTTNGTVIPNQVLQSIKDYRNAGGKFVFCTGRHKHSIGLVFEKNDVEVDGVISLQGSRIALKDGREVIGGIEPKVAKKVIEEIHKLNKKVAICTTDGIYYENDVTSYNYAKFFIEQRHNVHAVCVEDLSVYHLPNDEVYGKIVIYQLLDEDLEYIMNYLNAKYDGEVVCNSGASGLIEIVSTNYTKYEGAKKVANMFGVSENEVITMGDSTNDLTLINFGLGMAVESGDEELKKHAKYIAPKVENYPVSFVINKVLNNEDFI